MPPELESVLDELRAVAAGMPVRTMGGASA